MKRLLVVVDMQNDFLTGALKNEAACEILPAVKAEISKSRGAGIDVVFTRDTHGANYAHTQEGRNLPVVHCVKDTWGWKIADGLHTDERIFDKPTFGSVELAKFVREQGYDAVRIVGVCTDICVLSNAFLIKAYCPETVVEVCSDLCAGVTMESHRTALAAMAGCQIKIV